MYNKINKSVAQLKLSTYLCFIIINKLKLNKNGNCKIKN